MAADLYSALNVAKLFRISRTLFLREDGSPYKFYIEKNIGFPDLKHIIEKGCGQLTDDPSEASFLLCELKSDPKITQGYLPMEFIIDCVKKNTLLDVNNYRSGLPLHTVQDGNISTSTNKPSTSARSTVNDVVGKDKTADTGNKTSKDDSDEAVWWPSNTVTARSTLYKGRTKYTDAEDFKIIRHLIIHECYNKVNGNLIWKQMEELKITNHSYQSMKARFKKKIVPAIDSYDIPDKWKQLLTDGDVGGCRFTSRARRNRSSSSESEVEDLTFESLEAWRYKKREEASKASKENEIEQKVANEKTDGARCETDENCDGARCETDENCDGARCETDETLSEGLDRLDSLLVEKINSKQPCNNGHKRKQQQASPSSDKKPNNGIEETESSSESDTRSSSPKKKINVGKENDMLSSSLPDQDQGHVDYQTTLRRVQVMSEMYGLTMTKAAHCLLEFDGNFHAAVYYLERINPEPL